MSTRPIHAIVVAYHAADQLDACLGSLAGGLAVTVVDNSSSAAVQEVAHRHEAPYLDPGRNLGFGAGVNVALRELVGSQPVDVLLLNPDAAVTPAEIAALGRYLHQADHVRVGSVSPRLVDHDRREQRVLWPFPSPRGAWREALGLGCHNPALGEYVVGAVLLLRWEAVQEVGLFDERFFLYAEETDWQRRAVLAGWTSRICPDVTAQHRGAGTSDDPRRREQLFHAAHEIYIRKWYGSRGWLLYRAAAVTGATLRGIALRGSRRDEAWRRAWLYLRGPARSAASPSH